MMVDIDSDRTSVICELVRNRSNHQKEAFSDILWYLVLMIANFNESVLIKGDCIEQCPLYHMGKTVINGQGVVDDEDFIFLLKATCYHYLASQGRSIVLPGDGYNERVSDIENISTIS